MADTLILFTNSVLIGVILGPRFLMSWPLKEYKSNLHKHFFIGVYALISLLGTIIATWLLGNILTFIFPSASQSLENPYLTVVLSFFAWMLYYLHILKMGKKRRIELKL